MQYLFLYLFTLARNSPIEESGQLRFIYLFIYLFLLIDQLWFDRSARCHVEQSRQSTASTQLYYSIKTTSTSTCCSWWWDKFSLLLLLHFYSFRWENLDSKSRNISTLRLQIYFVDFFRHLGDWKSVVSGVCWKFITKHHQLVKQVNLLAPHCNSEFTIHVTLSLPESNLDLINVVLTFKSVDETLVCDHSNESYRTALSSGTVCFWQFCKIKFQICRCRRCST